MGSFRFNGINLCAKLLRIASHSGQAAETLEDIAVMESWVETNNIAYHAVRCCVHFAARVALLCDAIVSCFELIEGNCDK